MTPETITWIPVTERLPDADEMVLIYDPTHYKPVWLGYLIGIGDTGRWYDVDDNYHMTAQAITHWAEIPKGPTT